ncbi:hypothetical protein HDV05_006994 [Chytridiales sp. JEL 0842]|nr:hypothetical protein HDV05_006994 [Chytridiales sp. JEL 0842]
METDAAVAMDNLLHLETMFEEYGRDDGVEDGRIRGQTDGVQIGLKNGFDIGRELGFYLGASEMWLEIVRKAPESYPARAQKVLESMTAQIKEFPETNDPNISILDLLDKIRAKFKTVTSLLKAPDQKFRREDGAEEKPKLNF